MVARLTLGLPVRAPLKLCSKPSQIPYVVHTGAGLGPHRLGHLPGKILCGPRTASRWVTDTYKVPPILRCDL